MIVLPPPNREHSNQKGFYKHPGDAMAFDDDQNPVQTCEHPTRINPTEQEAVEEVMLLLAELQTSINSWIISTRKNPDKFVEGVGRRYLATIAVLNPGLLNHQTIIELGDLMGVTKQHVSHLCGEFSKTFGIRGTFQRCDEVRERLSQSYKKRAAKSLQAISAANKPRSKGMS